jgi:hypothetical protein
MVAAALIVVGAVDIVIAMTALERGDHWFSGFLTACGIICLGVGVTAGAFIVTAPL